MAFSLCKSLSIALLAVSLSACEPVPTHKTPPASKTEVAPKAVEVDPDDRAFALQLAEALTMSTHIGALHHCRATSLYTSPLVNEAYERMRTLMLTMAETGEQLGTMTAQVTYLGYQAAFMNGKKSIVTVPADVNPKNMFKADEQSVDTEAKCREVEIVIRDAMTKEGGYLFKVKVPSKGDKM